MSCRFYLLLTGHCNVHATCACHVTIKQVLYYYVFHPEISRIHLEVVSYNWLSICDNVK